MAIIRLNKQNYFHNLNECLKKVKDINHLIVVLKDNAYGHGVLQIAQLAKEFGINYVAVKNTDEAKLIQNDFKNILILSQIASLYEPHENYIIAINDLEYLKYLKANTKIALKLDTGMHRSGICENNLENAIKIIKEKKLRLTSAFTHYSSPKNINFQKQNYIKMKEFLEQNYPDEIFFHSANSSTLFLGQNDVDLSARVGIAQFGYCDVMANLKPVLSLWAQKISTRKIKKGDCIGYDEIYVSDGEYLVSNYNFGYADGMIYYKGLGDFYLADGITKVLGKVSMDSFSTINSKSEICVFDNALKYANSLNTNTYEALVRLSPFIKREIF